MKKFLSIALALAMTLSLVVVGASATEYDKLTDKASIKHTEAVTVMNKLGIISGYSDGSFKPAASITRGAAAKIICMTKLGVSTANSLSSMSAPFKDVSTTNVFAPFIAYCSNMKIVNGYNDNTFRSSEPVTGYAFAKMLLTALGKTGTYTGNGWEITVAAAAQEIGLFDGIDESVVMSKALSRDNACQMALNALNYSATSTDTYGVTVNTNKNGGAVSDANTTTTQYTFTSSNEAMSFYAVMNAQADAASTVKGHVLTVNYDGKITTAADSLLKTVFGVTRATESADAFGKPTTVYSKSSWTSSLEFASTAVKTYTTKVTLGTIYTDLGLTATKGYTLYVDGTKTTVAKADAQAITKGSTTALANSANGLETCVYKNSDGTYTIAQVNTYVGDVTAVTAATASKDRTITVTTRNGVSGTFTTNDFAVDDVVLYTYSNMTGSVGIQTVEKAKTVSGTVNAYSTSTGVTLDTTTYGYSKNVATKAAATKVSAEVVLDKYGYAIDVTNATATTTYAYVLGYVYNSIDGGRAKLLFTDGTVKTVATTNSGDGAVTENTISAYVANSDNTYTLTNGTGAATKANAVGTAVTTNNSSVLTNIGAGLVGTGSTIFLVATKNASGAAVYTVYTGIKAVPTIVLNAVADGVAYVENTTTHAAKVVFINAAETGTTINNSTTSNSNSIFVYRTTAAELVNDSVKGYYYTYDAVVNGTIQKLNVAANKDANHTEPIVATGVYNVVTYDANKIATLGVALTTDENTATGTVKAANNVIGLGAKYFGYASDCKVFTVDANGALAASTIAGITTDKTDKVFFTKNSSGDVNYIYVVPVKSAENSFSVQAITGETNAVAAPGSAVSVVTAANAAATTATVPTAATVTVSAQKTVSLVISNVAPGATVTVTSVATQTLVANTASYNFTVTATAENGNVQTCTVTVTFTGVTA